MVSLSGGNEPDNGNPGLADRPVYLTKGGNSGGGRCRAIALQFETKELLRQQEKIKQLGLSDRPERRLGPFLELAKLSKASVCWRDQF